MFGKISRKRSNREETSSHAAAIVLDLNVPDREVDGFLLVGESLYERDIIHAQDFQNSISCSENPPAYTSVVSRMGNNNQPTREPESVTPLQNANDKDDCPILDLALDNNQPPQAILGCPSVQVQPPTIAAAYQTTPATTNEVVRHAYEDIPFQLSPLLKGAFDLSRVQENNGILNSSLEHSDLGKYHYEFTLERSVLQA